MLEKIAGDPPHFSTFVDTNEYSKGVQQHYVAGKHKDPPAAASK